jgi:hypothetical protein
MAYETIQALGLETGAKDVAGEGASEVGTLMQADAALSAALGWERPLRQHTRREFVSDNDGRQDPVPCSLAYQKAHHRRIVQLSRYLRANAKPADECIEIHPYTAMCGQQHDGAAGEQSRDVGFVLCRVERPTRLTT